MSDNDKPLRLGVLGAGHVGGALLRALCNEPLPSRSPLARMEVVKVLVRDLNKPRSFVLPHAQLTTSPEEIINHPDINVVVALMGGMNPEGGLIRRALRAGKHVVTANKALLSLHGPDIERLAIEHDRALLYEAAVGGGMPVIRLMATHFLPAEVVRVEAILNGTCNFILTELKNGTAFAAAVRRAQGLGLAEADPSMDLSGRDAAQKLALLATMIYGQHCLEDHVCRVGIEQLDADDLAFAKAHGMALVLLGTVFLDRASVPHLSLLPTFVPGDAIHARVEGPNNLLRVNTRLGGVFEGIALGAGGAPTALSVISDLNALLTGAWRGEYRGVLAETTDYLGSDQPFLSERHAYYLRFGSSDACDALWERCRAERMSVARPAVCILEVQGTTLGWLREAMLGMPNPPAIVQYHPSLRPASDPVNLSATQ